MEGPLSLQSRTLSNKFCYNTVEYKVFSSTGRRKVVLIPEEGSRVLEKKVEIIWAKNN